MDMRYNVFKDKDKRYYIVLRRVSVIRQAHISPLVWNFLRFTRENYGQTMKHQNIHGLSFLSSIFYMSYVFLLQQPAVHRISKSIWNGQ